MNLKNIFNKLDEISFDQAIFSDKIYRKIRNLDDSYSVFCLEFKNNNLVWEKINNFKFSEAYECIPFNNLVYVHENNNHITIYNIEGKYSTKLMIYSSNNILVWDILNIPFDINNLNTHSLLNIPTHVNLLNEYPDECPSGEINNNYDLLDEFEPLHGWDNLLERSLDEVDEDESDSHEENKNIILDNDLDDDVEIKDNFIYPNEELHTKMKFNNMKEDKLEEYRRDPYDGKLYSYNEFVNYYGGEAEWDFMDHKKFLLREEYYKFTNTFCHLSNKKFMFLFNEFKNTY